MICDLFNKNEKSKTYDAAISKQKFYESSCGNSCFVVVFLYETIVIIFLCLGLNIGIRDWIYKKPMTKSDLSGYMSANFYLLLFYCLGLYSAQFFWVYTQDHSYQGYVTLLESLESNLGEPRESQTPYLLYYSSGTYVSKLLW